MRIFSGHSYCKSLQTRKICSSDLHWSMKWSSLCLWGFLCLCVLKVLNWAPAGLFGVVQSGVWDMDTNWHQRHDTATIQSHGLLLSVYLSVSLNLSLLQRNKHVVHAYSQVQWGLNPTTFTFQSIINLKWHKIITFWNYSWFFFTWPLVSFVSGYVVLVNSNQSAMSHMTWMQLA